MKGLSWPRPERARQPTRRFLGKLKISSSYWALYGQLNDVESFVILAVGILAAFAAGVPLPLMAVVFRNVIESFPPPEHELRQAVYELLAIAAAYFVLTWVWTVTWGVVGGRISRRLQESLVKKTLGLDMEFFDTEDIDLTSMLTADTQTIQRGTSEKVGLFIQSISYFIATFVTGFVLSPPLTGVLFAAIFPSIFIFVSLGSALVSRNAKRASAYTEKASNIAEQAIKAVQVVQAFGVTDTLADEHASSLHCATRYAYRRSIFSAVLLASIFFICYSTNALAFYWGAKLGGSSGTIYAVVFLVLDASFVFTQVGPFIQTIAMASGAGSKILQLVDRPSSSIDSYAEDGYIASADDFQADISYQKVSFAYPSRKDHNVLNGLEVTFKAGTTTGIVGLSGSGKSSLAGLLLRLYDANSGRINIGDKSLKEFTVKSLRSHISLVDQEPVLFSGSILDNIRLGIVNLEGLTDNEVRSRCTQAAEDANVDFIDSLEHGIDSDVGSSGGGLSGGQRQRICLARALVRRPQVLILDEPTSALDSTSELKILQSLRNVAKSGCTIIMIAHRLATVKDLSSIVVISDGKVQEQGTHQALLEKKDGIYKSFVEAQTVGTESPIQRDADSDNTLGVSSIGKPLEGIGKVIPSSAKILPSTRISKQVNGQLSGSLPMQISDPTLSGESLPVSIDQASTGTRESEQSSWKLMMRCVRLLSRRERWLLSLGLCASAVMGALIAYEAIVFGHLITILQSNGNHSQILADIQFYCLMFFIISIIALISSGTSNACFGVVSESLLAQIRENAIRTVLRQDQVFFQSPKHSAHRLVASISSDANHIAGLSGSIIATLFSVFANIVAGLTVALVFAWSVALVLFSVIPAIIIAGYLRVIMLQKFEQKHRESFKKAAALASEAVQNIRTVAAFGCELVVLRQYKKAINGPYNENFRYFVLGDLALTLSYSIVFFTYALAYWWGSQQVRDGRFSELDFFTMLPAFLLTAQQSGQLFSAAPEILQARAAAKRLFKILDEKPTIMCDPNLDTEGVVPVPEKHGSNASATASMNTLPVALTSPHTSPSLQSTYTEAELEERAVPSSIPTPPSSIPVPLKANGSSITFSHTSLVYPDKLNEPVLQDVNFHVHQGSTVGLVGPSGAGKSSLFSLLERFYDPVSGAVLIDHADIRNMPVVEHRRRLAYVPQEPCLFEGTILYNIQLGAQYSGQNTLPSQSEVEEMCKYYELHSFVASMPEGYMTEVGVGGNRLSGGQKQRIALARALMRRPKILILDEATSALDAHSEQEVQRILNQLKAEGRTIIMIAHRMVTVRNADAIIVLENGRIVEYGKHEELVHSKGIYARMVAQQDLG